MNIKARIENLEKSRPPRNVSCCESPLLVVRPRSPEQVKSDSIPQCENCGNPWHASGLPKVVLPPLAEGAEIAQMLELVDGRIVD